ncbi:MAG: YdeI/OmpD-associated family protein [Lachnospiraceae bacterium]|nr:YdeI/OmpD-associated family protein [Lachnospiraceae bacterium]
MNDIMEFADREEFREWLSEHCQSSAGVWLLFGKSGGPKTIKAGEALEEAKENGQWDAPKPMAVTEEQIDCVSEVLKAYEPAYTNFLAMSLSVKKTYTRAYFDAKTDAGREKRIAWMVDRLNRNLKPM